MFETRRNRAILLLCFASVSIKVQIGEARRLSFKESLTAYAEKSGVESGNNAAVTALKKDNFIEPTNLYTAVIKERYNQNFASDPAKTPAPSSIGQQFPLWKLTSSLNLRQPLSHTTTPAPRFSDQIRPSEEIVAVKQPIPFFTVPGKQFANSARANHSAQLTSEKSDGEIQPRNKKEAGNTNQGLKDVLWNTATALWSVNKEHFLPTFLHTKTGGKLSLVRDSIFKPITILSQYKSGVQEINNEKLNNLARLSANGRSWGWNRPTTPTPPQVVVVKLQPENSHFMTLARYIFRLTKHTAVTKWKLKRALLDLQIRALKKLIRILKSKNFAQKVATIRILTNAVWKGKRAIFRFVTGSGWSPSTTPSTISYPGVDNSVNVDLTYSSLNKHSNGQFWTNNFSPPQQEPTPPPPSYIPPAYYNPYEPPYMTPASSAAQPSSLFLPPAPLAFSRASIPSQSSFATSSSDNKFFQIPFPSTTSTTTPEPLIETPSYSNVLKTMGINPSNLETTSLRYSNQEPISHHAIVTPNFASTLQSPTPTVVYYSTQFDTNVNQKGQLLDNSVYPKINEIEKPTMSAEYHTLSTEPFAKTVSSSTPRANTTPAPSFRLKLLELMNINSGKQRQI